MIFPPMSEEDPAYWAAAFAGHVAVGSGLAAIAVWADLPAWTAPFLYLLVWEGIVQRLGAGGKDALVDTWAVALGAGMIWAAWEHVAPAIAGCIVLSGLSVWLGVRRRL